MTSYLKYDDQISDKDSLEDFLNQKQQVMMYYFRQ